MLRAWLRNNPGMNPVRIGGVCAVAGALWLAVAIGVLTVAQADFMRGLGWDPLLAPTFDWPSGLALGPLGGWMTATFLGCGLLLAVFALTFGPHIAPHWPAARRWLTGALTCASCGLAGLAFATDPTLTTRLPTWHGRLHDAAFVVLGIGLAVTYALSLRVGMRTRPGFAVLSGLVCLATVAGFAFKGLLFYAMLGMVIVWYIAAGLDMMNSAA